MFHLKKKPVILPALWELSYLQVTFLRNNDALCNLNIRRRFHVVELRRKHVDITLLKIYHTIVVV